MFFQNEQNNDNKAGQSLDSNRSFQYSDKEKKRNPEMQRRLSFRNINEKDFDENEYKLVNKPQDNKVVQALSKELIE